MSGSSIKDSSLPELTSCDSSRCFLRGLHRQHCMIKNVTRLLRTKLATMEYIKNERDCGWDNAAVALSVSSSVSPPSSIPQPWCWRVAKGFTRPSNTETSQSCENSGQPSISHVKTLPLYTNRNAFPEGNSLGGAPVALSMTS